MGVRVVVGVRQDTSKVCIYLSIHNLFASTIASGARLCKLQAHICSNASATYAVLDCL